MADIIDLNLKRPTGALLQRWRHLLSDEPTALIAEHILPALAEEIEASLVPASPSQVTKATMVLMGSFKIGADLLEDRPTFARAMKAELAKFPADLLDQAITGVRRDPKFPFLPSIGEMVAICDELLRERRKFLNRVHWMEAAHDRRRDQEREAAEREHAEAEAAERDRRRREEQLLRIRERCGIGLSAEEIELAWGLRRTMHWPLGTSTPWYESLDAGELWAAKLCRRLALAARAARAEFVAARFIPTSIPSGHAAAITRLALDDEAGARRQLEEIEAGRGPRRSHAPNFDETRRAQADFTGALSAIEAAAWGGRGGRRRRLRDATAARPDASRRAASEPSNRSRRMQGVPEACRGSNRGPTQTLGSEQATKGGAVISTMEIYDQERSNVPRCAKIAPEQRRLIGASSQLQGLDPANIKTLINFPIGEPTAPRHTQTLLILSNSSGRARASRRWLSDRLPFAYRRSLGSNSSSRSVIALQGYRPLRAMNKFIEDAK
jgi:hypothetical protein